jgi:hypothetical protein
MRDGILEVRPSSSPTNKAEKNFVTRQMAVNFSRMTLIRGITFFIFIYFLFFIFNMITGIRTTS